MDGHAMRGLIELDNRFYREHAGSFSATRSAPWDGWRELAGFLRSEGGWGGCPRASADGPSVRHVFDLACGNLRFERFLMSEFPQVDLSFTAWDGCPGLAEAKEGLPLSYRGIDILGLLLHGAQAGDAPGEPAALSVCFGFMHHVPGEELRQGLLKLLVGSTEPEGVVAVSFWQFMSDPRLRRKAAAADALAAAAAASKATSGGPDAPAEGAPWPLDEGDHYLGWQGDPSPLRYCHHFDEAEIDRLAASAGPLARELARYSADGASGALNRYLLLQRVG